MSPAMSAGAPPQRKDSPVPKGPSGQKRPADAISRAVGVMKIAMGECGDTKPD